MYGVSGYDLDSSNREYQTDMGISCVPLHTSSIKAIEIYVMRRLSQIAKCQLLHWRHQLKTKASHFTDHFRFAATV